MNAITLAVHDGRIVTTSNAIAEHFGKRHDHVLRAIRNLDCSPEFNARNFGAVEYIDEKGEARPAFEITRDGFTFLAMGFTGKEAAQWKERYIEAFNQMEAALRAPAAVPSPAPRTRKALPGGLTIDQQDAIKALVRSRADAQPQEKRAKAAITLWSAINSKYKTTGKKDGYKNIPAEQFGEVLSLVARVPIEGELMPAGEPVIPPPVLDLIARKTHELAMGQYGVIRQMIEDRVLANIKAGAKPQELVQVVADFGGCTEESVLVNTWDLVQLSRVVATALNAAGGALSTIQKFEQTYGIALYQRAFDDRLPPQLLQVLLGNHKENIRGVF